MGLTPTTHALLPTHAAHPTTTPPGSYTILAAMISNFVNGAQTLVGNVAFPVLLLIGRAVAVPIK